MEYFSQILIALLAYFVYKEILCVALSDPDENINDDYSWEIETPKVSMNTLEPGGFSDGMVRNSTEEHHKLQTRKPRPTDHVLKNFTNYTIIAFTLTQKDHLEIILDYEIEKDYFFITHLRCVNRSLTMMIPSGEEKLRIQLSKMDVQYKIVMKNQETQRYAKQWTHYEQRWLLENGVYFDIVNDYTHVQDFLRLTSSIYPDLVEMIRIGTSFQNHEIYAAAFNRKAGNAKKKILLVAGIHGREWAAVTTSLYLLNNLIESQIKYKKHISNNIEWYIVPVLNPDGYEQSINFDRLWKNNNAEGEACRGVDIELNFKHFDAGKLKKYMCTDYFGGITAFSEPETRALRDLVQSQNTINLFVSLHSGECFIAYPKALNEYDQLSNNYLTASTINLLNKNSDSKCIISSITDLMGDDYYNSAMWAYDQENVEFAVMMSINKPGKTGIDVEPEDIQPTVQKIYDGIDKLSESLSNMVLFKPKRRSHRRGLARSSANIKKTKTFIYMTVFIHFFEIKIYS